MTSPWGKVNTIPEPIVAGKLQRRLKFVGTVGPVAQATAAVVTAVWSFGSSRRKVTGEVGVTPIAAGVPIPITVAAAVTRDIPSSCTATFPDAVVRISQQAAAVVTFEVLWASDIRAMAFSYGATDLYGWPDGSKDVMLYFQAR
jgi:hypothetical protein